MRLTSHRGFIDTSQNVRILVVANTMDFSSASEVFVRLGGARCPALDGRSLRRLSLPTASPCTVGPRSSGPKSNRRFARGWDDAGRSRSFGGGPIADGDGEFGVPRTDAPRPSRGRPWSYGYGASFCPKLRSWRCWLSAGLRPRSGASCSSRPLLSLPSRPRAPWRCGRKKSGPGPRARSGGMPYGSLP
jgi:hypothetical protein